MSLHGDQLIGGERSRRGATTFHATDPARGVTLEPAFAEATEAEVDRALVLAASAHDQLSTIDREARAGLLEAIGEAIEAIGEPLIERASAETALPHARLVSERGRTVGQLRFFAGVVRDGSFLDLRIDRADPQRMPLPKPDVRQMQRAIGPVAVFGASNFPLAFSVAGGDTAAALAAGSPVVVKAHPHHPGTSELVGRAIVGAVESAALPHGTFSLLHGRGVEVGEALVGHPATQAVAFTGSLRGGKALFDLAMRRPIPIPCYAEMGSTNPVFLMPALLAADAARVAGDLHGSVTLGVGQFCTNPGVVVVPRGAASDLFITRLRELTRAAAAGTMLHEGIATAYARGLRQLRTLAGIELTVAGADIPRNGRTQARPALVVTDKKTFLANPMLMEELFGPSTVVVQCADTAEMASVASGLPGQLTATVHILEGSDDEHELLTLLPILERRAGRVLLNGFPTGVEVAHAMHHGGPFPATTDSRSTSVGSASIRRFTRPVCYQGFPSRLLPAELRDDALGVRRLIDGRWSS